MILNHVADRAYPVVESAPTLNSKFFRHGDLHGFDMAAIPERFQDSVGKTEKKHVMHRPLAKVMVNAEDAILSKGAEQNLVEFLGRGEIPAERLFNNHSRTLGAARLCQLFDDQLE